jgi:hypothetical protein
MAHPHHVPSSSPRAECALLAPYSRPRDPVRLWDLGPLEGCHGDQGPGPGGDRPGVVQTPRGPAPKDRARDDRRGHPRSDLPAGHSGTVARRGRRGPRLLAHGVAYVRLQSRPPASPSARGRAGSSVQPTRPRRSGRRRAAEAHAIPDPVYPSLGIAAPPRSRYPWAWRIPAARISPATPSTPSSTQKPILK